MWEAIQWISSTLTFAAFLTAITAFSHWLRVRRIEHLIRFAPEDQRASLIEQTLENYHFATANLTKDQRYELVSSQLNYRATRLRIVSAVVVAVAALLAAIAGYAILNGSVALAQRRADNSRLLFYEKFFQLYTCAADSDRATYFHELRAMGNKQFPGLICDGLKCDGGSLIEGSLDSALLPRVAFSSILMDTVDLRDSVLTESHFDRVSLQRANLSGSDLYRTVFNDVNASDANFSSANCRETTFNHCKLLKADFTGADLTLADFRDTDVTGEQLTKAWSIRGARGIASETRSQIRQENPNAVESDGMRFVLDHLQQAKTPHKDIVAGKYWGRCTWFGGLILWPSSVLRLLNNLVRLVPV